MATAPRKRPADMTGINSQRLAAEKAEEIKLRAEELGMMQATERESREDVVDLSNGKGNVTMDSPIVVSKPKTVEVRDKFVTVRINEDIQQMTFGREDGWVNVDGEMQKLPGAGALRHYDFEANRKYTIPADLADHLEEIGYIWH